MLPVAASFLHAPKGNKNSVFEKLDKLSIHILVMGIWLFMMSLQGGWVQPYSLLALPLLFLYSGERGNGKLKYFFYIFYPLHLAVLEGLKLLIETVTK